jgi:hypothetical protein
MAKHAHRCSTIQSFGQRGQNLPNALGRGFEAVEWGIAPSTEGGLAGLAAQGLNPFAAPMRAIPDQRVNVRISDLKVDTQAVRTAEALGVNAFRCATSAFQVTPGCHGRAGRSVAGRKRLGLATGWTVIGRARLEQPGERSSDSSGLGMLAPMPIPEKPNHQQYQHQPARIGRHV